MSTSGKCAFCNKKKMVLIQCMCQNKYCLEHNLPIKHNCTHKSGPCRDKMSTQPTGEFSKITKI